MNDRYNPLKIPDTALKSVTDMTGKIWKLAIVNRVRLDIISMPEYMYVSEDKSKGIASFYVGGETGVGYNISKVFLLNSTKHWYHFVEFVE